VSDGSSSAPLDLLRRVRAIAQTGLEYGRDPYDLDRYRELAELAQRLIATVADRPLAQVRALYLPERGYPTPKVDLRVGVFVDGRVLLVRETSDGRWALPGGWGDEQEAPLEGAAREVREEAALAVTDLRLVGIRDRALHDYRPRRLEHIYKLFFLGRPAAGALTSGLWGEARGGQVTIADSIEIDAAGFFPCDALPPLSLGRTLAADVELLRRYGDDPSRPPFCD